MRTFLAGIRRRLAAERGAALVLGLGITIALTITGTTVAEYSTSDLHQANRSAADQSAFALAEAGLASALSVLGAATDPTVSTLLPSRTTTYSTGTATWWGSYDATTTTWTLYASGQAPTPPPQAPARRTVSERVRIAPSFTAPQANRAWDYVYSTRTGSTCDENISSSVSVGSPIYTNGNLCVSAGGSATDAVAVRGKLTLSGSNSIVGGQTAPVSSARIAGGCKYYTNVLRTPCSSADNVWAASYDTNVPLYTPPTIPWDSWYANAAPGPAHPCTQSSGTVPTLENETTAATRNNSVTTPVSLTPSTSYSCRSGSSEFSWDAGTRTLTVNGTVFIDGSAKIDNGLVNQFKGQGTLYLSGTFLVSSNSKLCAKLNGDGTDCDMPGWDPTQSMLVVLANGNGGQVTTGYSVQISSSASFQGAVYSAAAITIGSYAQTKGPMIATTVVWGSSCQTYTFGQMSTMPAGTPGTTTSTGQMRAPEGFSG